MKTEVIRADPVSLALYESWVHAKIGSIPEEPYRLWTKYVEWMES